MPSKPKPARKVELDQAQQAAVQHGTGPMLVIAGAGTGKTTVLVERIARLIREGAARPDEVLALTFSNQAATEMRDRVLRIVQDEDAHKLCASTIHSYCYELLVNARKSFGVLDETDLWIYLRQRIADLPLNYFIKAADLGVFLHDLIQFFNRCHEELKTPDDYDAYLAELAAGRLPLPRIAASSKNKELSKDEVIARCREIASVFRAVEAMLREDKLGSFGHMVGGAVRLLQTDATLLANARQRARYILLDEFQDVNLAQLTLVDLLAGEEKNVFAVGDPDQAIYRFRGASSAAFDEFNHFYPHTHVVSLEKNQRSTALILRSAFSVISNNPETKSARQRRRQLVSAREQRGGSAGTPLASLPAEIVLTAGPESETADIAAAIELKHEQEGCPYSNFVVLYRTHSHREKIIEELDRRHIPVAITGLNVMETAAVRDVLACLRALVSPRDSISLLRVASLPQFRMQATELRDKLRQLKRNGSLRDVLAQSQSGKRVLQTIEQARAAAQAHGMKIIPVFDAVVRFFALDARPQLLCELRKFVQAWCEKPFVKTQQLAEFLAYMDYFVQAGGEIKINVGEPENGNERIDAVQCMTAHGAKGLEFKHVFILRANSQSFPANYKELLFEFPAALRTGLATESDSKELHQQEERRLFYVAMTRAEDRLSIYAKPGTGAKDKTPPGFLRGLLSDAQASGAWTSRLAREVRIDLAAAAVPVTQLESWLLAPSVMPLEPLRLSASSIERYNRCPLQFKLEREWRLPTKPAAAMQYGAAMHAALKLYGDAVREGRASILEEMQQVFRAELAKYGLEDAVQRSLLEQQGARHLAVFHQAQARIPQPRVQATEWTFTTNLAGVEVTGRLDRIDQLDDASVAVVDYKTGASRTQEHADDSLQLSLYALAVEERLRMAPEQLVFYNLETNTAIVSARTPQQLQEATEVVQGTARNIQQGNFEPHPGQHCRWCPYRSLCPAVEQKLYNLENVALTTLLLQ